jgi:hypothetical protein
MVIFHSYVCLPEGNFYLQHPSTSFNILQHRPDLPRNVPDEDALDIKMMPASAPLVIEFQIPPVGDDLIFLRKYSLNAPTFNPKAR